MSKIAAALKARVPPPLVMLVAGAFGWLCSAIVPRAETAIAGSTWLGIAVIATGLCMNLYPKALFRRARTTINPLTPKATTALLTEGIYRYSRNPMYLGHALILLGLAVYGANLMSLLAVPAYVWYVTEFQIKPEESALMASFPEQFAVYAQSTRRWA